jgi:hypothetical protein
LRGSGIVRSLGRGDRRGVSHHHRPVSGLVMDADAVPSGREIERLLDSRWSVFCLIPIHLFHFCPLNGFLRAGRLDVTSDDKTVDL